MTHAVDLTSAVTPREPSAAVVVLMSLLLFTLHAFLAIPVGSTLVPFGESIILAVILLLARGLAPPLSVVYLFCLFVLVGLVAAVTGPSGPLSQRISSTVYLCTSIFICVVIYLELRTWPRDTLRHYLLGIALTLIVGSYLEILTPLSVISDAFRNNVPHLSTAYSNNARDIADTGIIRPKFFTTEPARLAHSIGLVCLAWLVIAYDERFKLLKFTALILAGLIAVRSPSLLVFYPPGIFYCYFSPQPGQKTKFSYMSKLPTALAIAAVGALALYIIAMTVMAKRVDDILAGTDASMIVRLVLPVILAYKILRTYPLFGVGTGGTHFVVSMAQYSLLDAGASLHGRLNNDLNLFPEASLEFLATYGFLGCAIALYILNKIHKKLFPGDGLQVLVAVLCFSLAGNYWAGANFWAYLAILWAVGYVRWHQPVRVENRQERTHLAPAPTPAAE